MAAASTQPDGAPRRGREAVAAQFNAVRQALDAMDRTGCSEAQAYQAQAWSRLAGRLVDLSTGLDLNPPAAASRDPNGGYPGLRDQQRYIEFASQLEGFRNRVAVANEELRQMQAKLSAN